MERVDLPGAWPGSKVRLYQELIRLGIWPDHQHHVSLFGGGGAEIFAVPPSKLETYNDVDDMPFNFLRVLRDDTARLVWRVYCTPYSQREYERAYNMLHNEQADPLERAWAFAVNTNMNRVGEFPSTRGSFGVAIKGHGQPQGWVRIANVLLAAADRLRGVQLCNKPWQHLIRRYNRADTLWTIDPPYPIEVLSSHGPLYRYNHIDHDLLLTKALALKGKVIIHSYGNPLYNTVLAHLNKIRVRLICAMSSFDHKPSREEKVWFNFTPNGESWKCLVKTGR